MSQATDCQPRHRIREALAHRGGAGTPFSWGFGPTAEMQEELRHHCAACGLAWERLRDAVDDRRWAQLPWTGVPRCDGEVSIDEWGIRRKIVSHGAGSYGEFSGFPLQEATVAADLDRHGWPAPSGWDVAGLRQRILAADPSRQRACELAGGNPFELYCWLTGLEQAMANLIENPQLVEDAMTRITSILDARLRSALVQAGDQIDLVFLADDLGSQESLLLSRPMYRRFIQPHHRKLIASVRELAPQAKVLFHSDGAVFDILPDLVDAGIDCLEAVQTDAGGMQPERLKERWAGRLAFHGAISVQQVLPRGTTASVAAECRRLDGILGVGGGWIAAPSHAVQIGTPPANVLAMLEAILGPARWAAALNASRV